MSEMDNLDHDLELLGHVVGDVELPDHLAIRHSRTDPSLTLPTSVAPDTSLHRKQANHASLDTPP